MSAYHIMNLQLGYNIGRRERMNSNFRIKLIGLGFGYINGFILQSGL